MLLVTPSAAAEFLRLSKSTLAKMRISGRGPSFRKHGRSVVYEQAELENWSNDNQYRTTSQSENSEWPQVTRYCPDGRRRAAGLGLSLAEERKAKTALAGDS
jgi:hypothetical protein